jgi:5'(3')-deoxyribonucleotidase
MAKTINFDMDGTFVNLYGVENWLEYLINEDTTPYEIAKPLFNMSLFARYLNKLQQNGWEIAIVTWLSQNATNEYSKKVAKAKLEWLKKHLPSVEWDRITILDYGTPKQICCDYEGDILFDDELNNRANWNGKAFDVENIIEVLKTL